MLLNRHNLSIRALASKDASRINLQGVAIQPGRTVATNGHALAIVTAPATPEGEFPHTDGETHEGDAGPEAVPVEACIITAEAAAAIEKAIPKNRFTLPALCHARVTRDGETVTAVTTDLETVTPIKTRCVEGEFPDIDQVVPQGEPVLSIGFNCELLSKALAVAASCLKENRAPFARFDFYGPDKAVKVTGQNVDTGQTITLVVMPARL